MHEGSSIVSSATMENAFCASQLSAGGRGDRRRRVVTFFSDRLFRKPKLGKRFFSAERRKIEVKNFLPQIVPFDERPRSRHRVNTISRGPSNHQFGNPCQIPSKKPAEMGVAAARVLFLTVYYALAIHRVGGGSQQVRSEGQGIHSVDLSHVMVKFRIGIQCRAKSTRKS